MIAVGVDTHKDSHLAVALDQLGEVLGELTFAANIKGYNKFIKWSDGLGNDDLVVGIEGAGSWGAGLCETLMKAGRTVFEVERPSRQDRARGKSDLIDALAAAKTVLAGRNLSVPRSRGVRGALAALVVARSSAVSERTRLHNQIQSLAVTAPAALRERIGSGRGEQLERRLCSMRVQVDVDIETMTVFSVLRDLAKRSRDLGVTASRYEVEITELVTLIDATLLDECGIGPISAAKLLVCDPRRFRSEQAFARSNGTAPLEASSGKTVRHRLSRRGDRQVNNAIHIIALTRSVHDEESRAYIARRISEGKTSREAMRALKRHISRQLYKRICEIPLTT